MSPAPVRPGVFRPKTFSDAFSTGHPSPSLIRRVLYYGQLHARLKKTLAACRVKTKLSCPLPSEPRSRGTFLVAGTSLGCVRGKIQFNAIFVTMFRSSGRCMPDSMRPFPPRGVHFPTKNFFWWESYHHTIHYLTTNVCDSFQKKTTNQGRDLNRRHGSPLYISKRLRRLQTHLNSYQSEKVSLQAP